MGKVRQRNWLIILTMFLVSASGIALLLSIQKNISFHSCAYGGEMYKSGDLIPDYNEGSSCFCNSDGSIKCDNSSTKVNYSDFTSQNLKFSYDYLNALSESNALNGNVNPIKASLVNGTLNIAFEREAMCTSDGEAPVQSGFYILSNQEIRLTTLTNIDATKYTQPCKIEDIFVISNIDFELSDDFKAYYQTSEGNLLSLGVCIYNKTLYGNQEAFKASNNKSVCLCDLGVVTCKDL